MTNSSTHETSYKERLEGISTGVMILMSNELKLFIEKKDISEEDFITTLDWFQDWNFDTPFILAKYNYFESGIDYAGAMEIVELWQEGIDILDLNKMMFVIQILNEELNFRIEKSQRDPRGTFKCSISVVKGKVSVC